MENFQELAFGFNKPYHSTSFPSNKKNTLMHWNYLGVIIHLSCNHVIYIHNLSIFMKKYRQHFWHFNFLFQQKFSLWLLGYSEDNWADTKHRDCNISD